MKSLETNRSINTALVYAALGAGALLMIFPFIWMVFTSFKSAGESVQIPPTILPKQWMKENYLRAIASLPFPQQPGSHLQSLNSGERIFCSPW